jgi:ribonuclease-3
MARRGRAAAAAGLEALQRRLGYRFRDEGILDLALTHRSASFESGAPGRHNEALEFLGDAVLGFVAASALYERAGDRALVGALARRRAAVVSEAALAAQARALDLGSALRLGKGEAGTGGRDKPSLLADAFEAVVAAIYLDGGLAAARAFILDRLGPELAAEGRRPAEDVDPKTRLQEILQARGVAAPEYRVVEAAGPDHSRRFTVEVVVEGRGVACGEGASKKAAGTEAARAALRKIRSIVRRRGSAGPRPPGGGTGSS